MINKITISLKTAFVGTFAIFLIIISSLLIILYYENGKSALADSANLLGIEINERIIDHITDYTNIPIFINKLNKEYIIKNNSKQRTISLHFLNQIKIFNRISSIYFGNTYGGLANAGKELNTDIYYIIETKDFIKGTFNKYELNQNGVIKSKISSVPNFDSRKRPWFIGAKQSKKIFWTDPYVIFTGNDMAISCSMPISNKNKFIGVAAVDIFLSQIDTFLENLPITENGISLVLDENGYIIASSKKYEKFTKNSNNYSRIKINNSNTKLLSDLSKQIINNKILIA